MDTTEVASALKDTMWLLLSLGGPLLIATLIIGLAVSLVQAVTQINEPTLVFLPKVLVLGAALTMLGPFMIQRLNTYSLGLMDRLVSVGGQ